MPTRPRFAQLAQNLDPLVREAIEAAMADLRAEFREDLRKVEDANVVERKRASFVLGNAEASINELRAAMNPPGRNPR